MSNNRRAIKHGKKVAVFELSRYGESDTEIVRADVVGNWDSDHRVTKSILPTNHDDLFIVMTNEKILTFEVINREDAAALAVDLAEYETATKKVFEVFADLLGPSPYADEETEEQSEED